MKYIGIAIIYTSFFSLIGIVCYITQSAYPLGALLLTPNIEYKDRIQD